MIFDLLASLPLTLLSYFAPVGLCVCVSVHLSVSVSGALCMGVCERKQIDVFGAKNSKKQM